MQVLRHNLTTIVFFLFLTNTVFAESGQSENAVDNKKAWIEVTGTASREIEFDYAELNFEFSKDGDDTKALTIEASQKLTDFDKKIEVFGIISNQIKIHIPRVTTRYENETDAKGQILKKKFSGYTTSSNVTVKIYDFGLINKVMSAGFDSDLNISSTYFYSSKEDQMRIELGKDAVKSATAQARDLILAAGQVPGRIFEIKDPDHSGNEYDLPSKKKNDLEKVEILPIDIPIRPGVKTVSRSIAIKMEMLPKK
jgi:uncharacterized protein YggE